MNTSINFVLPKDKDYLEKQKRARTFNVIAAIFPLMVGVISLLIFLATQAVNPVSIKNQQDETIAKIEKYIDRKTKLLIVHNRLDNIDSLLKDRRDFADNINIILSLIPGDVALENLEIDNNQVLLTASSLSLKSIDDFINNLIAKAEKKEVIRSLLLENLTFEDRNNNYLVSLKSVL